MKIKKIYLTLIAVVIAFSTVLLTGCSGGSGTTNTPTEKWVTLANKSKNEEMFVHIITTEYTGKDETQLENLNYYKNTNESSDNHPKIIALKENNLQFDTYEGFDFTFTEKVVKARFEVVSEQDQEFEFEFFFGVYGGANAWVKRTIVTQANTPYLVELDVKDFEGVSNGNVKIRLRNIPMVEDIFHQQTWYNTSIKWTIQNVAFINK